MPRERTYPRAVPNQEEPVTTKSSVKETAINAAVWTLSAAVVLGVGTWVWKRAKRTVIKENDAAPSASPLMPMAGAYLANNPWAMQQSMMPGMQMPMMMPMQMQMPAVPAAPNYAEMMPAALQMQPNLNTGNPGMRRRKANGNGEAPSWFRDFAAQQNQRFESLERKLEDSYEDDSDELED